MTDDLTLLATYSRTRDAEAFSELVHAHAGLVYGACLRVLGNPHDAEEVAQECFLELARKCDSVTTSVPGWLHALATCRARDAIRRAVVRREREREAAQLNSSAEPPSWQDIAPRVDEALDALPEELRLPLVLHYLQGRRQAEIAATLNLHQATVSRRLETGVAELRKRLEKLGALMPAAMLDTCLRTHAADTPVPASLHITLGKMAMAGVGTAMLGGAMTAPLAAPSTGVGVALTSLAMAAGVALVAGTILYPVVRHLRAAPSGAAASVALTATAPAASPAPATATPIAVHIIKPKDGRAQLAHFPCPDDYQVRGFSDLLALQDCLRYHGRTVTWNDLLGYSGDAFSCDGISDPAVRATDVLTAAAHAYGFAGQWTLGDTLVASRELHAAIENREPVLVRSDFAGMMTGRFAVAIGTDARKRQFLLAGLGPQARWLPEPGADDTNSGAAFRLGAEQPPPAPAVRLATALRNAVAAYRQPDSTPYRLGRACLVAWPGQLREWAAELSVTPMDPLSATTVCPGYFTPLALSVRRQAAANFLRLHANDAPPTARPALARAAEQYAVSAHLAEQLFARLYLPPELLSLDWRARLRLENTEGPPETNATGQTMPTHLRAAVIRHANAAFADPRTIDELCSQLTGLLRAEDAAMAALAEALRIQQPGGEP